MTAEFLRANPYPGLRAFEPNESGLFFGRERETDELRRRLRTSRFVAVLGGSGSGKSSLVRSGLIPSLHSGFMSGAGSSWRVAITRPGEDPIENLAEALDQPGVLGVNDPDGGTRLTQLLITLRDSSLGLIEAVRHARLPAGDNVLVVVDQFEELFRFRRSRPARSDGDDAVAFVRLLLEASKQAELPIYVVLTMRSEFIGECMSYDGLPEAINGGQYLVPGMSRDAMREAIEGPAQVSGTTVAPRLMARLLNEIGDRLDRLPVLQHAMMRTWDRWDRDHAEAEPIDIRHYEAIGTMENALSWHADEAFGELTAKPKFVRFVERVLRLTTKPDQQQVAERIFKTVTETTEDGHGVRRPSNVLRLAAVCGVAIAEIESVINHFRAPGRAFLQPAAGVPLDPRQIVDISHESLMRVWKRLVEWVHAEAGDTQIYRRLVRDANLEAEHKASLWTPPQLTLAQKWYRNPRHKVAWAEDPAEYKMAVAFLKRSEKQHHRIVGFWIIVALGLAFLLGYLLGRGCCKPCPDCPGCPPVEPSRARTMNMLESRVDSLQRAWRTRAESLAVLREVNAQLVTEISRAAEAAKPLTDSLQMLENRRCNLANEWNDLSYRECLKAFAEKLTSRGVHPENAAPSPGALAAELRARAYALAERERALTRMAREMRCGFVLDTTWNPLSVPSCPHQDPLTPKHIPPPASIRVPYDPVYSDSLHLTEIPQIPRGTCAADTVELKVALFESRSGELKQANERLGVERDSLAARHGSLRDAVRRATAQREALAARVTAEGARNRDQLARVSAKRQQLLGFDPKTVEVAMKIGGYKARAERLEAENKRLEGILAPRVEELLRAAGRPGTPGDLAALLVLRAWRWAPYDPDDPAHREVYNTMAQVLGRIDKAAALRMAGPGEPADGKPPRTSCNVLAKALCERVTRPLTEEEWRKYVPGGCPPELSDPCAPSSARRGVPLRGAR